MSLICTYTGFRYSSIVLINNWPSNSTFYSSVNQAPYSSNTSHGLTLEGYKTFLSTPLYFYMVAPLNSIPARNASGTSNC